MEGCSAEAGWAEGALVEAKSAAGEREGLEEEGWQLLMCGEVGWVAMTVEVS